MKKWLIWCLTVLAMVCLIPGIVLKAAAETVPVHCAFCGIREEREARRYEKYDSTYHRVYVTECQNCHKDGNITHLQVHSGGTQGPTCTEGKICKKCGAEYDIPGHAWGEWKPNGDGTHTRRCTNPNCDAKEENVPCGGDSRATCIRPGTCTTCGGSYYGGHDLVQYAAKAPTCTEIGWDAYETCSRCDHTTYTELPALNHDLKQHAANAAQLEKLEAATAWALSGSLSAEDVTARTNGEYLSVAFETAGSLTQPTGRVRLALPAGLLEGKKLVRIAPDGTQTEMPFETERGKLIYTLDFANSELPVMLFRLVPQPTAL